VSKPVGPNHSCEKWYDSAFQGDYLRLYAHRDEAAARDEASFIISQTAGKARPRIVDIACGPGRHLLPFSRQAEFVVGVDRSAEMLSEAARRLAQADCSAVLVRADMRHLPFRNQFTCATLLFTSFGYFPTDQENLSVIRQASCALRPGGVFWMDYINEPQLRQTLEPYSRVTDGRRVIEERRRITEDRRVEKQIRIIAEDDEYCLNESVKLYSRRQIEDMFAHCDLKVCGLWGSFQGNEYRSDSPRLIIMGRKDD